MRLRPVKPTGVTGLRAAFSLAEVLISLAIAIVGLSGIIGGHLFASRQTMWTGSSYAAQLSALQRLEQTYAARWDPSGYLPLDELVSSNFPVRIVPMTMLSSGTNYGFATNTTTITTVATNPPLRLVSVQCTWSFMGRTCTNTAFTYRSADQ